MNESSSIWGPQPAFFKHNGNQREVAALHWDHPAIEADKEEETFTLGEVRELVWFMLSELKAAKNTRLANDCFCIVAGLNNYYGENGAVVAKKHGCSRQNINKMVKHYRGRFGVIGDAFAKRSGAGEVYSLTNKRNRKCTN